MFIALFANLTIDGCVTAADESDDATAFSPVVLATVARVRTTAPLLRFSDVTVEHSWDQQRTYRILFECVESNTAINIRTSSRTGVRRATHATVTSALSGLSQTGVAVLDHVGLTRNAKTLKKTTTVGYFTVHTCTCTLSTKCTCVYARTCTCL